MILHIDFKFILHMSTSTLLFPKKRDTEVREASWNSCKNKHKIFWKIIVLLCYKNNSLILDQLALTLSSLAVLYLITATSVQEDESRYRALLLFLLPPSLVLMFATVME